MPSCVIKKCRNSSGKVNKQYGITYHKFPSVIQTRRKEWIEFTRINRKDENWFPSPFSVICCKHFQSQDFYRSKKGFMYLKKTAVPCENDVEYAVPNTPPSGTPSVSQETIGKALSNTPSTDVPPVSKTRLYDENMDIINLRSKLRKALNSNSRLSKTLFISRSHNQRLKKKNLSLKMMVRESKKKFHLNDNILSNLTGNPKITELKASINAEIKEQPTNRMVTDTQEQENKIVPAEHGDISIDIKIETIGEPSNDCELLAEYRMVIVDIVQSIMSSLDLLVKSDPDTLRSTNVRDKILEALFCYHHLVDDKNLNLALPKETNIFDNNDSEPVKEIENVMNLETEEDEISDSKYLGEGNIPDEDYEELDFLTDDEYAELKRDTTNSETNLEEKHAKKTENVKSLRSIKKILKILRNKDTDKDRVKRKYTKRRSKQNEIITSEEATDSLVDTKVEYEIEKNRVLFESAIPRFVCEICDVTLISEHQLVVHKFLCKKRQFYYGNPKLEDFWNDLKCPLCEVKFQNSMNLTRHFKIHRVEDIESAFAPLKEKHWNPMDPENNMQLLNDFILEFEKSENVDGSNNNMDNEESESSNEHKKQKEKISNYLKFNLRKIVYDIDFDKDLYCNLCDLLFKTKEELKVHRKKLNDRDTVVCNYCDKTFAVPMRLIRHIKTHKGLYNPKSLYLNFKREDVEACPRQLDYKVYVCKYCLVMFVQEASLQSHMGYYKKNTGCYKKIYHSPRRNIQRTKDGKLQCDKCEKAYKNYYLFYEHLASHGNQPMCHCECGKDFKSEKQLKNHIDIVHNRKFQVICEVCGVNVTYFNLRRHMRVHSSLKPYICDYCNKTFKYKEAVTAHIRTHTNEKPWQCQYCEMAFSEKRRYNIHINIHEGRTPYKCELCPSAFVSRLKLNAHVAEHRDCRNTM